MAIAEACQLWIKQRIEEELQDHQDDGKAVLRMATELQAEIEKVFQAKLSLPCLRSRITRQKCANAQQPENPATTPVDGGCTGCKLDPVQVVAKIEKMVGQGKLIREASEVIAPGGGHGDGEGRQGVHRSGTGEVWDVGGMGGRRKGLAACRPFSVKGIFWPAKSPQGIGIDIIHGFLGGQWKRHYIQDTLSMIRQEEDAERKRVEAYEAAQRAKEERGRKIYLKISTAMLTNYGFRTYWFSTISTFYIFYTISSDRREIGGQHTK